MTPTTRPIVKTKRIDRRKGSGRTQEQRRTDARTALLVAAREIVALKGWVGMTLGDVGIAAGYSRGIATHHFGTKPELLRELAHYIGQHLFATLTPAAGQERGLHAILRFVKAYLGRRESGWTNTRAMLILMAEGTTDNSEVGANLSKYNESIVDFLVRHFQEGVDQREIRPNADTRSAAFTLIGMLRGIMMQKLLKDSRVDLSAMLREVQLILIYSYARRPAAWLKLYPAT
jgi:AcrR family transcriptional regulator